MRFSAIADGFGGGCGGRWGGGGPGARSGPGPRKKGFVGRDPPPRPPGMPPRLAQVEQSSARWRSGTTNSVTHFVVLEPPP